VRCLFGLQPVGEKHVREYTIREVCALLVQHGFRILSKGFSMAYNLTPYDARGKDYKRNLIKAIFSYPTKENFFHLASYFHGSIITGDNQSGSKKRTIRRTTYPRSKVLKNRDRFIKSVCMYEAHELGFRNVSPDNVEIGVPFSEDLVLAFNVLEHLCHPETAFMNILSTRTKASRNS